MFSLNTQHLHTFQTNKHKPEKKKNQKKDKTPYFSLAQGYITSNLLPNGLFQFKTQIKKTPAAHF